MNPLFQQLAVQPQQVPNNLFQQWQQWQQFRQSFNGDGAAARQQIQQLRATGRISQDQYDQAVQMANQFAGMFGVR